MPKDNQINLRMDAEEAEMLERLAQETVRTKSDMVRWLIRKAWAEMNGLTAIPAVHISDAQPE